MLETVSGSGLNTNSHRLMTYGDCEMNNAVEKDRRLDRRRFSENLSKVRIEIPSVLLTVLVIVLAFVAIIILWFYARQIEYIRLTVFFLSLIVLISVVVLIDQVRKNHLRHLRLQQVISQRTSELETTKAAAEVARLQAEQINHQLQASVGHANLTTQQAVEADRSKNEFLAEMSHQIRIPMNAIMGFSEMLADENLTEQQKKQVGIIRESSRQLLQLINDILDFSKIEAGKLEIEIAECSLESILAVVESLTRPLAMEKGLQFEIIRSQPLPEFIRTDATRLKQCLINLVSSAIRFTDKGYVYIRIFWDNSGSKPFIRFDIEDTGSYSWLNSEQVSKDGQETVLPADLKLFRPMQLGAGLGLAVTQRLAELLEGSITISSAKDKGSVFTLVIPTGMPQAATARRADAKDTGRRSSVRVADNVQLSGRALVAEDSPTNQALIELLLKKLGIEVVVVENGRQAVQKAIAEKFDVIIMDIQMPLMNGYEATKLLRKDGVEIPIIALTACAMKGDDEKCFAAGCNDYLPKPIDRKKLVETLMKYLSVSSDAASAKAETSAKTEVDLAGTPGGVEIDWHLLMERVGGQELVDEIIPIFIKDNTDRMRMLTEAIRKNDDGEIKFYAHSLKGATATVGAAAVSDIAKQLEAAARDSDSTKYKSLFDELNVRFTHLMDFLSRDDWKQAAQQAASQQHTEKS